mgnify:FL=1
MAKGRKIRIDIDPEVYLEKYRHLQDDQEIDIDLIWGSRDSGKSRDTAMRYIEKCLTTLNFRCILARKVYGTIKESQYQLLVDVIKEWGMEELFECTYSPISIRCVNGGQFVGRGFDKAEKIKSMANPNHAWVEEANELTREDFIVLYTTLRSNDTKVKLDLTFNPECEGDYQDFWLYKDYMAEHYPDGILDFVKEIWTENPANPEEKIKTVVRSTHSTYQDNPWCNSRRIAVYENLEKTDPYFHAVYARGLWGKKQNLRPFIVSFDPKRHKRKGIQREWTLPIWLSFDFNRDPMCVSVYQVHSSKKVRWLEVIKQPKTTIWDVCEIIKLKYPHALFMIGGDHTGNSKSALIKNVDEESYHKAIKVALKAGDGQLRFEPNPRLIHNRVLCNTCLVELDIEFDEDKCKPLFYDFDNAEVKADGSLVKDDREDEKQQLDALDTYRYAMNLHFKRLNPLK